MEETTAFLKFGYESDKNPKFNMLPHSNITIMSEIRIFFRHCPACGRRFEIRVAKKEEVSESHWSGRIDSDTDEVEESTLSLTPLVLSQEESKPAIVEEKDFNYTYKCKHCGHQWTEIHEETHTEPAPEGYTDD